MITIFQNAISAFYLLFNVSIYLKKRSSGFLIYVIGCIVMPTFVLGNINISYEISMFPFMFIFETCVRKKPNFKLNFRNQLRLYYCLILVVATCYGMVKYCTSLNVISMFGTIRRLFIVMCSGIPLANRKNRKRFISIVLWINFVVSTLALISVPFFEIQKQFYAKNSESPLALTKRSFFRGTGTFNTPIALGAISLVIFTYLLYGILFDNKEKRKNKDLVATLILGIVACSKLSILGIVIVLFISLALYFLLGKDGRKRYLRWIFLSCGIGLFFVGIVNNREFLALASSKTGLPLEYYARYFSSPFLAFSTRFSGRSLLLSEQLQCIRDNILIGVGFVHIDGIYAVDSSLIVILLTSGISGLAIWVLIYFNYFLIALRKKNLLLFLLSMDAVMISTGINVESTVIGILVFGLLEGIATEETLKEEKKSIVYSEVQVINRALAE